MKNIDIILRNILWYQKKHNCSIWEAYDAYDEPFHSDYEPHPLKGRQWQLKRKLPENTQDQWIKMS